MFKLLLIKELTSIVLFLIIRQHHANMSVKYRPLKPHFYIVKPGCTGVYICLLIFALNHRLWILVRTASLRLF